MGPLAKLFACCLNLSLEMQASLYGWCTPTQAGFWGHDRLDNLLVLVDYILVRAQTRKLLLVLCLVDLEKAFDTIPCNRLSHILDTEYGVGTDMLETIRHILINILGQVPDGLKEIF